MARRRVRKLTMGKQGIQHAGTIVGNTGGASVPAEQVILKTEAGPRNVTGANQDITAERDTGNKVNVGDLIKYVNLFIQCGHRNAAINVDSGHGWLEWALVCCKETETNVPITTIGVQTLGVICTNMFRNECIFTGAMPIATDQPNYLPISLKIPTTKQFIRIGDEWRFITYFRDMLATSSDTAAVRLIKSFIYKGYQ